MKVFLPENKGRIERNKLHTTFKHICHLVPRVVVPSTSGRETNVSSSVRRKILGRDWHQSRAQSSPAPRSARDWIDTFAPNPTVRTCAVAFNPVASLIQSRPQSSSLSRMTEGEKSSGEPWNRRLSHWFSRGTKNTHMIGSFKWKVCLTLFSARAPPITICEEGKAFCF